MLDEKLIYHMLLRLQRSKDKNVFWAVRDSRHMNYIVDVLSKMTDSYILNKSQRRLIIGSVTVRFILANDPIEKIQGMVIDEVFVSEA
jgi:hypothetical protein